MTKKESELELEVATQRKKIEELCKYVNYLAEQLEHSIDYTEYVAEHLDNVIDYTEYVAEHLDNVIDLDSRSISWKQNLYKSMEKNSLVNTLMEAVQEIKKKND